MKYALPLTLFLALPVAFGQQVISGAATETRSASGVITGSASFPGQVFIPPAVAGVPYSAEQVSEHVQTLADGTHITQSQMHVKMYRDSQGRTRTERPLGGRINGEEPQLVTIQISDPVAGVQYTLDTQAKVAHRAAARNPAQAVGAGGGAPRQGLAVSSGPVPPPIATATPSRLGSAQRDVQTEKLAPQVIEGVLAEGTRTTITIPTGQQGNDRPFQIVSETWMAPDLKMVVLSKNSDPRSGDSIMRLINISRNEPDPSLFQPPADYQVVDETGQFTIHYTR